MGEWQEPNLGKSLGVSSLSVSSISHPYTVHTLHDSKTLVNFIHFQTDMALIEIWMALVMLAGWFL